MPLLPGVHLPWPLASYPLLQRAKSLTHIRHKVLRSTGRQHLKSEKRVAILKGDKVEVQINQSKLKMCETNEFKRRGSTRKYIRLSAIPMVCSQKDTPMHLCHE